MDSLAQLSSPVTPDSLPTPTELLAGAYVPDHPSVPSHWERRWHWLAWLAEKELDQGGIWSDGTPVSVRAAFAVLSLRLKAQRERREAGRRFVPSAGWRFGHGVHEHLDGEA